MKPRPATLLIPYGLLLTIFLIVPGLALLRVSFASHAISSVTGVGYTLGNYASVLGRYDLGIVGTTLRLAAISTLLSAVLAYPPAYVLARSRARVKALITLLVAIPFMTGAVIKVLGWYIVMEPFGLLNGLAGLFGVGRLQLLGNDTGVLIGLIEFALPLMIFSLTASIERIAPMIEEAAANLGASPLQIFRRVVVPMTFTGLLSGILLCFSVSASAYVVPLALGGSRIRMVAMEIYDQVLVAFDWPNAAALSTVVVLVLGLLGYGASQLTRERRG
jgi:ABC-type spermidine/putrescine transport system permease subunit I